MSLMCEYAVVSESSQCNFCSVIQESNVFMGCSPPPPETETLISAMCHICVNTFLILDNAKVIYCSVMTALWSRSPMYSWDTRPPARLMLIDSFFPITVHTLHLLKTSDSCFTALPSKKNLPVLQNDCIFTHKWHTAEINMYVTIFYFPQ